MPASGRVDDLKERLADTETALRLAERRRRDAERSIRHLAIVVAVLVVLLVIQFLTGTDTCSDYAAAAGAC